MRHFDPGVGCSGFRSSFDSDSASGSDSGFDSDFGSDFGSNFGSILVELGWTREARVGVLVVKRCVNDHNPPTSNEITQCLKAQPKICYRVMHCQNDSGTPLLHATFLRSVFHLSRVLNT